MALATQITNTPIPSAWANQVKADMEANTALSATNLATVNAKIDKNYTICTSGTRPVSPTQGDQIYETDRNRLYVYGTAWQIIGGSMPRVRTVKSTGVQSIPDSTTTIITFPDGEEYDSDGFHSGSSGRITVPAGLGGVYSCGYHLWVPASVVGAVECFIKTSPGQFSAWQKINLDSSASSVCISGAADIVLAATEYIELNVTQYSFGSVARNVGVIGLGSIFWATYVCPV